MISMESATWTSFGLGGVAGSFEVCYSSFPFVDGFDVVVDGRMSFEYLNRLIRVLEPAIDLLTVAVESGERSKGVVNTLLFMVAAHARIEVVCAYEVDILSGVVSCEELLAEVEYEWQAYVDANGLLFVEYDSVVSDMLSIPMSSLWQDYSLKRMSTVAELLNIFSMTMSTLRVVSVGSWLVQSDNGRLVSDLTDQDMSKPLLPRHVYADLLKVMHRLYEHNRVVLTPELVQGFVDKCCFDMWSAERASDWLWMLLSTSGSVTGYCYQLMFEPVVRFAMVRVLGKKPLVSDVLWAMNSERTNWARMSAVLVGEISLHVEVSGNPDLDYLVHCAHMRIGAPSPVEPDYYARALVDDFIRKHRSAKPLPAPPPVDEAFEQLTIVPPDGGLRGFVDVSQQFYAKLGEPLSPRASVTTPMAAGLTTSDEYVSELDSERVRALHERLSDGAVVHEPYYDRSRRRFMRRVQRPRLDASEGRSYHVFNGFPADGGGTTDCWVKDLQWDVPGWSSYVAHFTQEQRTVNFVSAEAASDIRIDCTGIGTIELGSCRVAVDGTVLWFSESIKLQVATKGHVALRITIPESGSAIAVGKDIRRYMYIPGYAVVVRSFDIVSNSVDISLVLDKRFTTRSGCQVRQGNRHIERGRHRFKITGLASEAPVKVAIKTEPVDALDHVTVSGMRLRPRTREYVTVIYDTRNVSMYLSLLDDALVSVSVLQVVNFKEFDLVAESVVAANTGKSRK